MTRQTPDTWPDPALEATMLADAEFVLMRAPEGSAAADLAVHVKALLERVRTLEGSNARLRAFLRRLVACERGEGDLLELVGEVKAVLEENP